MKWPVFFSLLASPLFCQPFEPLTFDGKTLYAVSTFEEGDYLTACSMEGEIAWELFFSSKIRNWKIVDDRLIVLSRDRQRNLCYLSCFDLKGELLWEKPIFAPSPRMIDMDGEEEEENL